MAWIIGIFVMVMLYVLSRFFRSQSRDAYIKQFKFPQGLHRRLSKHHPNLTETEFQLVSDSLRQFFLIHLRTGRQLVSMPSQVTDDLWHEFILYTQAYQTFCKKAFGHFLHHTPAAVLSEKQRKSNAGLRRIWLHACQIENINSRNPIRLPLIFAIDAQLKIANGFHYVTDCKKAGAVAGTVATAIYCGGDLVGESSCGTASSCAGDGTDTGCNSGCSSSCSGGCGGGGGD